MPLHHGGGDGPAPGTAGALRLRSDHAHSWCLLVTTEYPSGTPTKGHPQKASGPLCIPLLFTVLGGRPLPTQDGRAGQALEMLGWGAHGEPP